MKIVDQNLWDSLAEANKHDSYGAKVMQFAEAWANLMERQIAQGKNLEDIARKTSFQPKMDITGAQVGQAVRVLKGTWVFGEALHNHWHKITPEQKRGRH
jgi:hypothetical protein